MKPTIIDCVQGSPEWHKARVGIPSASNFDMIVTTTGARSKQREKYLYKLAGEFIIGTPEETYQNAAMQRGLELESEARTLYELITGQICSTTGFWLSDGFGCSPDGIVAENGGFEAKCPTLAVHVGYLLDNKLPTEYFQQVQGSLLVTGREWWDFMSYYPGMKPLIVRVFPDKVFLKALRIELELVVEDLKTIIERIK
jgi:hypothetical protein